MAAYTCLRHAPMSWASVIAASPRKTYKFDITSVAGDGTEVCIRNTDGTATVLSGCGLMTSNRRGATVMTMAGTMAGLTGGTITAMSRNAEDGTVLETVTGLDVIAAGPSTQLSFSRPPGEVSSLDWVLASVESHSSIATAPVHDEHAAPPAGEQQVVEHSVVEQPVGEFGDPLDVSAVAAPSPSKPARAARALASPLVTIAASTVIGFLTVLIAWQTTEAPDIDPGKLRYVRPASIPSPADNVPTPSRIALGKRLFSDVRLSGKATMSCATCHDPEQAFTDGRRFSSGVEGNVLRRHSPTLWNVAWGRAFFWDGRMPSLEMQALKPIEDPDEMGGNIDDVIARLRADPSYVAGFAVTYPATPSITAGTLAKALASYQRSLVAPPTRFDRWISGDRKALSAGEAAGFRLFNGKAGCGTCHQGWAFTDHGFHDIGLPGIDKGRGTVMGIPRLDHAFKTPSLRELKWTAPYMHDGSLATLDDVLTHYERGIIERSTQSRDLPRNLNLTADERRDLLAFLGSLSSDATPKPQINIEIARSRSTVAGSAISQLTTVGQKDKRFSPEHVRIGLGETLAIVNNDTRPHNVSIAHPRMGFSSGMQEPGEEVKVPFPEAGQYEAFCGVHPNMRLTIEVLTAAAKK